jgi:GTPase SAR1 family protein
MFTLAIVGDSGVGKTSICETFANTDNEDFRMVVSNKNAIKSPAITTAIMKKYQVMLSKELTVKVAVVDVNNAESWIDNLKGKKAGVVIVVDISQRSSVLNAKKWIDLFQDQNQFVFIFNQIDSNKRILPDEMAAFMKIAPCYRIFPGGSNGHSNVKNSFLNLLNMINDSK